MDAANAAADPEGAAGVGPDPGVPGLGAGPDSMADACAEEVADIGSAPAGVADAAFVADEVGNEPDALAGVRPGLAPGDLGVGSERAAVDADANSEDVADIGVDPEGAEGVGSDSEAVVDVGPNPDVVPEGVADLGSALAGALDIGCDPDGVADVGSDPEGVVDVRSCAAFVAAAVFCWARWRSG